MQRKHFTATVIGTTLSVATLLVMTGCTRHIYVPVEKTTTDTLTDIRHHSDTVIARDSVYVEQTADVRIKEVYRWKERIRTRIDTVYRTRVDSVPVIISVKPERGSTSDKTIWKTISQSAGSLVRTLTTGIVGYLLISLIIYFLKKKTWKKN